MMATAAATTALLTARPTPTAPPLTLVPKWQLVMEMASPKTTALTRPIDRSHGFKLSANECRNDDSSTLSSSLPKSAPPVMATTLPTTTRQKSEIIMATTRGTMKADRLDGERAHAVELLGDGHGAELGGVVGADAAREHEADEDGADLAQGRVARAEAEQAIGA